MLRTIPFKVTASTIWVHQIHQVKKLHLEDSVRYRGSPCHFFSPCIMALNTQEGAFRLFPKQFPVPLQGTEHRVESRGCARMMHRQTVLMFNAIRRISGSDAFYCNPNGRSCIFARGFSAGGSTMCSWPHPTHTQCLAKNQWCQGSIKACPSRHISPLSCSHTLPALSPQAVGLWPCVCFSRRTSAPTVVHICTVFLVLQSLSWNTLVKLK